MNWEEWIGVILLTLLLTVDFDDAHAAKVDTYFLAGVRNFVVGTVNYADNYQGFRTYAEARSKGAKCYDLSRYMADIVESRGVRRVELIVVWIGRPQAHTVVGVDLDLDGDPYILDINQPLVLKLSQRPDLKVDVVIDGKVSIR